MKRLHTLDYKSPIGVIEIASTDEAICSIMFTERDQTVNRMQDETSEILKKCISQLDEYFKGERHEFTFPYSFEGTDFQKTVWNALTKITYSETGSYKD